MILNISGNIPEDTSLLIKINKEVKTIDNLTSDISFNNEGGKLEIDIEQQISKSNIKPIYILIYFLTIIIQGVFNALLMNVESKWYRNIKAYCLKAKIYIDLQQDTNIRLTYINSKYNEIKKIWALPTFKVEPDFALNVSYVLNPCDFKNQYFNYIKKLVSFAVILIILFIYLLKIAIVTSNIIAFIITSVLILSLLLTVILVSFNEHKRLKKLYQSFLKQNEADSEQ